MLSANQNKNKIILVFFILLTFTLFLRNLNSPNLWFDESGQFWMAKGLNHFSEPYSAEGDFYALISNNNKHNMDPGGFTILLRFWTIVSSSVIWLRLLPFLFFLLTYFLFLYFVKKWSSNWVFAFGLSGLLLISPSVIQNSFELRPYSWSFFSILCCLYFVDRLRTSENKKDFLIAGIIMSILMWGRYNCIVQVAGAIPVLFFIQLLYEKKNIRKVLLNISVFSIPVLISLISIFFITMRYQYSGRGTQEYVEWITISYNPGYLLTIPFLVSISPLLVYLLCYFYIKIYRPNYTTKSLDVLFYFTITENALFILLSILGYYPYSFRHRWSVDLHVLSLLNFSSLICIIYITSKANNKKQGVTYLFTYLMYTCISLIYVFSDKFNSMKYQEGESTYEVLQEVVNLGVDNICIPKNYSPNVRYLFEYGSLKNTKTDLYPSNIFYYGSGEFMGMDIMPYEAIIVPPDRKIIGEAFGWRVINFGKADLYVQYKAD
jgi:hypothetical protein